jgi:hypothetical protein
MNMAKYAAHEISSFESMDTLKEVFPKGEANELNFVLFSTSGVHGHYGTIEDAEKTFLNYNIDDNGDSYTPDVTFLIIHPRIVKMQYGNVEIKSKDDIVFLKKLRESSMKAIKKIGL